MPFHRHRILGLRLAVDRRPESRPVPPALTRVALAIIILNLVDAFGTLRNVAWGAEEMNPLMAHLLDAGPVTFYAGKFLLAAGGVLGIVAYGRTRAARFALFGILLPLYLLVAVYQIALVALI